ncbi:hypothetical protein PIB30_041320 [Stylosanthes scabra]|uniref:Uncharacterized protein n=1 Tax=Stylosanthes scabra TaxID=79078 RepID=A0ABU6UE53_9FABA|nr:hypothetical protein [Stylosanthes scabra]
MASKGKGKIYGPPTRASPRLAALRARAATDLTLETPDAPVAATPSALGRKLRMRVKYFTKQLAARDNPPSVGSTSWNPIDINNDSEEKDPEEDPKEEEPEEENPEMNSGEESEEVPEYIPEAEQIEEEEEVPENIPEEGLAADQDLEDEELEEEDPEMILDQDMENEEMEEEAEQDTNNDEEFVDYFELALPASPDNSNESLPPTDD